MRYRIKISKAIAENNSSNSIMKTKEDKVISLLFAQVLVDGEE